jgi:hypothetical protein
MPNQLLKLTAMYNQGLGELLNISILRLMKLANSQDITLHSNQTVSFMQQKEV